MSEPIVFLNGSFVPQNEAQVSVFDRGFLFADGVYEVVPVVQSQAVDFVPFVERLRYSLSELSITWSFDYLSEYGDALEQQLKGLLAALIKKNAIQEGGVYMQVTRGAVSPRDFAFPKDTPPTLVAFSFEKDIINSPYLASGVSVVTTEDLRWKRRDIKSVALLAQCMAKQTAVENKAFEAWMVEDGFVTEGSSSTAYIVKDNVIITRPLSNSILPGIRRKVILALASKENLQVEERLFSVEEAYNADEAFLSSATTLVLPITKIDGRTIGNGKVGELTLRARELYLAALKGQLTNS